MTPICNDRLTLVRLPRFADKTWECPRVIQVGEKGDKNGMPYTVKAFGCCVHKLINVPALSRQKPRVVWMLVKFKGDKQHKWDALCIGDTNSFKETLVFGGPHPNPVFTHYWPPEWAHPLSA